MRRSNGGLGARSDPQLGGTPHHAFDRRLHRERRAQGGRSGQTSGHHQPQTHDLLDQAFHGRDLRQGDRRHPACALHHRARRQQHTPRRYRRPPVYAAGDLGHDPPEDEEDGRGLPGPGGVGSRDHGAGLLLRLAAPGHQGGGRDRRSEGAPHHQRAHGRRAGLRPGQEAERHEDRRVRPGRRYVRYFDSRTGRRRIRGEVHQRRHAPGRRRLRPRADRLHGRGVQGRASDRPAAGPHGAPAPERGGGEG